MDPLADVLRSVRLTGGVFIDARFTAPWCVSAALDANDCRPILACPMQMIAYHVIISGRLLVSVDGEQPTEVAAGEVVILPRNDTHVLASAPGLTPVRAGTLLQPSAGGILNRIVHGGDGEATHMVCGFLATDQGFNPLIATLPRLLTLDVRAALSRDWIEASVRFAAAELGTGRLASSDVMSRLSETLLVEAVRHYASTCDGEIGWLKGLSDPHVGRALALMHQDLTAPWSPEALAKAVALSRTAFIERFTASVGMPPIRYLTVWRLQTAKLLLRETSKPVKQIAHAIGYDSEEAFSRAFKREFGVSPARWRSNAPSEGQ